VPRSPTKNTVDKRDKSFTDLKNDEAKSIGNSPPKYDPVGNNPIGSEQKEGRKSKDKATRKKRQRNQK